MREPQAEPAQLGRGFLADDKTQRFSIRRPSVLDDLELETAVERYLGEWSKNCRVAFDFHCGATGYVLKRSAGDELVEAIRQVANGGLHFEPSLASKALALISIRDSLAVEVNATRRVYCSNCRR
ncbi:MAG TPA: hypothetical protein VF988_06430 [Verrucomicrobiae bacterium]